MQFEIDISFLEVRPIYRRFVKNSPDITHARFPWVKMETCNPIEETKGGDYILGYSYKQIISSASNQTEKGETQRTSTN